MRFKGAGNKTRKFVGREAIRNKTVELMRKGLLVEAVGLKCFRANRFKSFNDPFWSEWKGRSKAAKPKDNV